METSVLGGDDPYLGLVLDGQFRLDEHAGSGSMARVYRARHLTVDRDVAVKVMRRELLVQADLVARFRREAQIAARLEHPNVIVVHAVGELPNARANIGGEPFVVLELLVGPSLARLLVESGGTLPLPRALHILLALCDALGEAHARGIVHRDIKPENVMLVRRGGDNDFVKVLDFGLAKTLDDKADWRTRAGAILGTPRYVSPEGAEGGAISAASDCYALATVLYQCLAGRTPFDGESAVSVLVQQTTAEPPDLNRLARDIPEPITRVIMQNLSKRPEARAADARILGRALVNAARSAGLDAEQFGLSSTLLGPTRRFGKPPEVHLGAPTTAPTVPAAATVPVELTGAPALAPPAAFAPPLATEPDRARASSPAAHARFADSPRSSVPRVGSGGREVRRSDSTGSRARTPWFAHRLAVFVACFMLGVAVALGIASALGAFSRGGE
jgi:serine/threonine-protein kinase